MERDQQAKRKPSQLHMSLLISCLVLSALTSGMYPDTRRAFPPHRTILVTPNLDDDDGDGRPDAEDEIINGPHDRKDLTAIRVPGAVSDNTPLLMGPGAELYRVVEIESSADDWATVLIEARGPRTEKQWAVLKFAEDASSEEGVDFPLDIRPFVLASAIDPVDEIFISGAKASLPFINQLKSILADIPNAPRLTVLHSDEEKLDVWMQDTTEIGFFQDTSISVALAGLRGKHAWLGSPKDHPAHLDRHFIRAFLGRDRCCLEIGKSLPGRRWIDWFGNLECTPPIVGSKDNTYPMGRILVGRQNELNMHDDVMRFLKAQGVQWPPIVLDTGFLFIGHVDEIVNFVPTKTGYKALVAAPDQGRELLEKLARDGHGDAVILEGKRSWETTVAKVLNDPRTMALNDSASQIMSANREKLKREMGLDEGDIIDLPVLFARFPGAAGVSLWPNPVNGLVIHSHYILSKPQGPVIDGKDVIEHAYRAAFAGTDTTLHFVDIFDGYSRWAGDVHCGTNTVRRRSRRAIAR